MPQLNAAHFPAVRVGGLHLRIGGCGRLARGFDYENGQTRSAMAPIRILVVDDSAVIGQRF